MASELLKGNKNDIILRDVLINATGGAPDPSPEFVMSVFEEDGTTLIHVDAEDIAFTETVTPPSPYVNEFIGVITSDMLDGVTEDDKVIVVVTSTNYTGFERRIKLPVVAPYVYVDASCGCE